MRVATANEIKILSGKDSPTPVVVYYPLGNAPYARSYTKPIDPLTSKRQTVRSIMSHVSAQFKHITNSQRLTWNFYIKAFPFNYRGHPYTIPDQDAFNKVNFLKYMNEQTIQQTAPEVFDAFTCSSLSDLFFFTQSRITQLQLSTNALLWSDGFIMANQGQPFLSCQRNPRRGETKLAGGPDYHSFFRPCTQPLIIQILNSSYAPTQNHYQKITLTPLNQYYHDGLSCSLKTLPQVFNSVWHDGTSTYIFYNQATLNLEFYFASTLVAYLTSQGNLYLKGEATEEPADNAYLRARPIHYIPASNLVSLSTYSLSSYPWLSALDFHSNGNLTVYGEIVEQADLSLQPGVLFIDYDPFTSKLYFSLDNATSQGYYHRLSDSEAYFYINELYENAI